MDQLRARVQELSNLLPCEDMQRDMDLCLARADQAVAVARSTAAASVYDDGIATPDDVQSSGEDY